MQLPPLWLLSQNRLRLFFGIFDAPKLDTLSMLQAQSDHSGWLSLVRGDLQALNALLPSNRQFYSIDDLAWPELSLQIL